MIDAESTIFNKIADALSEKYPKCSRYGVEVDTPAEFPCVTLIESDNYTYEKSLTDDLKEHNAWIVYDLNVYSNKTSGAKLECKEIIDFIDNEMQNLGFVRVFCNPTRNGDSRIYRMTARYRAVISEKYMIYKK